MPKTAGQLERDVAAHLAATEFVDAPVSTRLRRATPPRRGTDLTGDLALAMSRFEFIAHWLQIVTKQKQNRGPLAQIMAPRLLAGGDLLGVLGPRDDDGDLALVAQRCLDLGVELSARLSGHTGRPFFFTTTFQSPMNRDAASPAHSSAIASASALL